MPEPLSALTPGRPDPVRSQPPAEDPGRLKQVAGEFEALLLAQMLKSVREAGAGGWMGTGEDQATSSIVELAEQQFAQALASQGGLGLAGLVVQGLSPKP